MPEHSSIIKKERVLQCLIIKLKFTAYQMVVSPPDPKIHYYNSSPAVVNYAFEANNSQTTNY